MWINAGLVNTPMSMANSGHRSRISKRNGRRRITDTSHADTAWNRGGDVPITRSKSRTRSAAQKLVNMKLNSETTRHVKLRCTDG